MAGSPNPFASRLQLPPKPYFYYADITVPAPPPVVGRFVWSALMSAVPAPNPANFDVVIDGIVYPLVNLVVNPANRFEYIFFYNGPPPVTSWRVRYTTFDPNVISQNGVYGRCPWNIPGRI